ncbi:S8 family serine peptidase [Sulfurovum mangrovi]|uniref:S8 family serine peptidase n=2 Tax=Sulfurovum mangrovi TaxID=2893889 RepID=UPI001E2F8818|nr:S8 family serine peptidase [Sulfurovum mangrovi]UFH59612.1 S8 family serine peptidase [Sulfurovum mangrovi]
MKIYLRGLILYSLFTLPSLADTSTVMQNLKDSIQVKSKATDAETPHKRKVQVIAVFTSKDAKMSFMESIDLNHSNFKIKKSFPLIGPKKREEASSSGKTSPRRQVLVISSSTLTLDELVETIKNIPGVESVTEDQVVHAYEVGDPDDPKFGDLWGLENDNEPITDINATSAWEFSTGSHDIVIGILDTGVDYTHSDLSANIWTNPNEIADNNLDDDGNGYIDDIHGIDTVNNDSDPMDDNMHGTHVAGTIGAVGDNGIGIVGVNWNVKMIPCKFLDASGSGYTSAAVECINYFNALKQQGVNIVALNNSWGAETENTSLKEAIEVANDHNILFTASAGNEARNNDLIPVYPASYEVANVISVAASDKNGDLATFSNYGPDSVDLAAPGVDIWSTVPSTCTPDTRVQYFTEDFENGTDNWEFFTYDTEDSEKNDIPDEHWKLDSSIPLVDDLQNHSLSDSPGTDYKNYRAQLALIKSPIDLSTAETGVCLTMKVYGRTEDTWDPLTIQLSKDGGETWHPLQSISGDFGANWKAFSLIIPEEYMVPDLHIAFLRLSDNLIVYEGYNIDDISITSGTVEHSNYATEQGTSMATPHVTGAIALLASIDDNLNAGERKQLLFESVTDKSTYENKIATSGLLNAGTMLLMTNQAPVGEEDEAATDEDTPVIIDVLLNDTDINLDTLSIKSGSLTAFSEGGSAIISDNRVLYTPAKDFFGTETFTYVPTDGKSDGNATTVTVTVTGINDAPQGINDTARTDINTSVTIDVLSNDSDAEDDRIYIKPESLTPCSQGGSATIVGDQIRYTPAETFSGIETFSYVPTDGNADGSPTTVTVTVGDNNTGSGGGGGCTYNPNLKKFDAMFFVILMLSLLYPWRRKIIR